MTTKYAAQFPKNNSIDYMKYASVYFHPKHHIISINLHIFRFLSIEQLLKFMTNELFRYIMQDSYSTWISLEALLTQKYTKDQKGHSCESPEGSFEI